jgi:hypothetical protein
MTFAGHDAGPRGTEIESDFLSTLSVTRSRLVRNLSSGMAATPSPWAFCRAGRR